MNVGLVAHDGKKNLMQNLCMKIHSICQDTRHSGR